MTRWAVALVCAGCVAILTALTAVGYVGTRPSNYTVATVVGLAPRGPAALGADNLELAAARYAALLASPATARSVAAEIGESPKALAEATSVRIEPGTANVSVTVTTTEAAGAARAANAIAMAGVRGSWDDPQVTAELVAPGVMPEAPSGLPEGLIVTLGVLLGLTAGAAILAVHQGLGRLSPVPAPAAA